MASSWTSASWSSDHVLNEPSRDRAPRTSANDGGDHDDDVSALPERVISRLRNQGALEKICKKYSIPDGFAPILAGGFSSWSPPPPGSVCVYVESLDAGMRLPLHPFFITVLNHFGLAPGQLNRFMSSMPSLAVFRHFFGLCLLPPHGFYSIRGKDAAGLLFGRIRSHIRGWNLEGWVLLLGVIGGAVAVPGGVGGAFQVIHHGPGPHR
ncbi:hypothetical protein D1007_30826 [Hordeum vulgare]|nr:hypothetical protein D1007_30826 [Hordeum vulgare]